MIYLFCTSLPLCKGIQTQQKGDLEIDRYTDADWASNLIVRKSTSGYFTFVEGNEVESCSLIKYRSRVSWNQEWPNRDIVATEVVN